MSDTGSIDTATVVSHSERNGDEASPSLASVKDSEGSGTHDSKSTADVFTNGVADGAREDSNNAQHQETKSVNDLDIDTKGESGVENDGDGDKNLVKDNLDNARDLDKNNSQENKERENLKVDEEMCVDDVKNSDDTSDKSKIESCMNGENNIQEHVAKDKEQDKSVDKSERENVECNKDSDSIKTVEEKMEVDSDNLKTVGEKMEVDELSNNKDENMDKVSVKKSEISEKKELISNAGGKPEPAVKSVEEKVVETSAAPVASSTSGTGNPQHLTKSGGENSEEIFKCSKCHFVTKVKDVFDKHLCDDKGKDKNKDKDGSSSDDRKYQIYIVHDKEKDSFVCKACDFTNRGHGFEEHLMCHLMLRPYQCLYCKECFINRREISRHVLKVHNGAKMSCALRALKRAKAIIKEVTNSGVLYFMARVQGKVPLEKDPDKKKETTAGDLDKKVEDKEVKKVEENKEVTSGSGNSEKRINEGFDSKQKIESAKTSGEKTTVEQLKGDNSDGNSQGVEKMNIENRGEENKSTRSSSLLFNTSVSANSFSKLREVLTSSKIPDASTAGEKKDNTSTNNSSKALPKSSEDSSGIKILASYSLQDDQNQDCVEASRSSPSPSSSSSKDADKEISKKITMEPNFIMGGPSTSPENDPDTLSFLGPERPIFKPDSPSQSHSIIPQSSTSNSDASTLPPVPQLAAAPIQQKQQIMKTSDFFICGFECSFTCINKSSLLQHLKDIHSSRPDFPCFYCGYRDVSEEALVNHVAYHADSHDKTKPIYSCAVNECEFTSNMLSDFINHTKTSHYDKEDCDSSSPPPPITCNSCCTTFSDIPSFQTHLEDNIIHIVNCPHCPSKATERRALLNHISSQHPGKPKMVSVAKQLICNARKENGYWKTTRDINEMPPPALTPAPLAALNSSSSSPSTSVIDSILRRATNGTLMADDTNSRYLGDIASESSHSPRSESSGISGVRVKEELEDEETTETGGDGESTNYIIDENGVRRRIYVPMSERQAENFRCNFCTFVARDVKRLACHERSHGMPPTRKDRFKCMFCPQGFDSELKFRLHITCHPGLIKFLLYKCNKCEFDSNQKHTIVKHITCNRDKKHRGSGPVENQYSIISRSLESRVLECEHCNYMTRHKIHMAIHYQREHGILRDKSDFRIEGLTPTDTPFSGHDTTRVPDLPMSACNRYNNDNSLDSDSNKKSSYKKPRHGESSTDYSAMSVNEINERNELFNRLVSQQSALQPGHVLENQSRKFKCPICKYLLPKAADLKNHVKRHSEVGQITLVMFRCKYCSCMSTARELLYNHLGEKHPGKPIALVKKTVFIDTTEVDKSFAETAVEENLQQLEESVHNEIMSAINSNVSSSKTSNSNSNQTPSPASSPAASFEQLFVIPEGGDTFAAALHCPKCAFNSHNRQEIIYHVTSTHPEVKVISSDEDVEKLAKATTKDLHRSKGDNAMKPDMSTGSKQNSSSTSLTSSSSSSSAAAAAASAWLDTIEEVLIVPDDQVFKEPAICSRCDFSTLLRKDMVMHLQQYHPEIAVMGRNSYPIQVSAIGTKAGLMPEPSDDSCVVGSGSLDNKLSCLYENYGSQMKCLICGVDRPKKFFIHVHILRHLNIFLWKCSFCAHRGLQKYKMVDHIKKIHPGKPMSVRYLRVNVESRVSQFLSQFNVLQNSGQFIDGDEVGGNNSNSNSRDGEDEYSGLGISGLEDGGGDGLSGSGEFFNADDDDDNANDADGDQMSIQSSSGSTYVLGSDSLDEKIACLYQITPAQIYSCLACVNQFQRKFAIHRHIIITHLKVALLSCGYCGMQGVEKHQMVDHTVACHPTQPIDFTNNSVDIDKAVSKFLSDSCHVEKRSGLLSESEKSELIDLMKSWNASSNKNLYRGFNPEGVKIKRPYTKRQTSPFGPAVNKKSSSTGHKPRTIVDPGVIMLGREALDKELNCLYQSRGGGHFRCLICRWEFPRKYPLHRHIMLKHLRMSLVACPYCTYEGVEKYTVSAHIKEEHRDQPVSIKYVQPDVGSRVRHFVEDMANGISTSQDLIKRPGGGFSMDAASSPSSISSSTSTLSALIKMKREKSFDDFGDDDDDANSNNDNIDNDNDGEENDNSERSSSSHGLVVAMFGKKNKGNNDNIDDQDDIVVKTEIEDEEYAEGSKLDNEDNDDDNVNVFFGPSGKGEKNDDNDEKEEGEEEEGGEEEIGHEEQRCSRTYFEEEEILEGMEGGYNGDGDLTDKEARMKAIREKFLKSQSYDAIKRPQAYAPGSYRSPNGGKPKALDVITKIKVLKAKEGPITKFCCEKCTFTSVHRSNVVRHIYKIHEKYQTHVCPICNYQTLSLILMQTHMSKAHPGVEYTEESFAINPPRSKPRSKPLMGPLSFQRRKSPKVQYFPRPSLSDASNDNTSDPSSSSTTATGSHPGPKQYACAYCHYETNTQGDILAHTREKHTDSFDASVGKKTKDDDNDIDNDGEFPDAGALDDSASDACWERSKKAVKRKVSSAPDTLISGMVRSKRKFVFEKGEDLIQCGYCDVRETSMGRMQHHFEWEHPELDVKCKRIPSWRFVCKTCSVKTMATSKMKYHLNRHVSYRPYTCVNCGAFFPSPDQCRRHARSAGHEEQYVYIHNTKKEQRVEELLQNTRQLALKIQEDAAHDPDFDIGQIDAFLARYQDVKHNLKRSGSGSSPRSKKAKVASGGDRDYKSSERSNRPPPKSIQTLGIQMDVTIQCYICKFESSTVHQIRQHHQEAHPGETFLWTELERGFTCDVSGEAILDSSSFPSASEEVGYSTKMTLGSGSKTMRFKCKSCEFSSCVIQAMKSHLKSHQPKGFICPYCSRSFSGKEKLMRHQYCLHKGMATWVIHLRKASSTTIANFVMPATVATPQEDVATPQVEASTSSTAVCYVCNKCPFTSENLLKYRRHLGVHKEFRRNISSAEDGGLNQDKDGQLETPIKAEIEGNENDDNYKDPEDNENDDVVGGGDKENGSRRSGSSFKCGHCEFSALGKDEIEAHHFANHPDDEPITIDLKAGVRNSDDIYSGGSSSNSVGGGGVVKRKASDLILDLEPRVKMRRISKSTLEAYHEDENRLHYEDEGDEDDDDGGEGGDGNEGYGEGDNTLDIHDGDHSELFSDETFHETEVGNEDEELDEEVEDVEEGEEDVEDGDKSLRFSHEDISEAEDSNSNAKFEYGNEDESSREAGRQHGSLKIKFPGLLKTKNRTLSHNENNGDDDGGGSSGGGEGEENDEDEGDEEIEEEEDDYHEGVSSPIAEDSEELARQLGLVENQTMSSNLLGTDDSDMMIMEFNGMKSRGGSSRNSPTLSVKDDRSFDNSDLTRDLKLKVGRAGDEGSSISNRKNVVVRDGDNDDVEDDDDDDADEDADEDLEGVNVSLGSPLPMISLGDGMDMDTI